MTEAHSSFVLDNSVVLTWCFRDHGGQKVESILDRLGEGRALVPNIWPLELTNGLLVAERRGILTREESENFLDLVLALPIEIRAAEPEHITGAVMRLSRKNQLSSYDASYLDLALREAIPLATLDKALARAARDNGVVVWPEAME